MCTAKNHWSPRNWIDFGSTVVVPHLQVVQLCLHVVDVQVKVLLTDLPVKHKYNKGRISLLSVSLPVKHMSFEPLALDNLLYEGRTDTCRVNQTVFASLLL